MIAVDLSPLVWTPGGGVAHALRAVLRAWVDEPPSFETALFAPAPLGDEEPVPGGVSLPAEPLVSSGRTRARRYRARRYRAWLARRLEASGADALWVPWSAFPVTPRPVVVTIHELPFVRLGPIEGRLRTWRHRQWLARAVARCAAIVTPSKATRDDLLSLHPEAAPRIHAIPNGFDPRPWEEAEKRGASRSSGLAVVVGTGVGAAGTKKKGVDVLFDALPRVRSAGFRAVLVGAWSGRSAGDLRSEAAARVETVGSLPEPRLRELVASAGLLLHPARSEGFGYPPLEAMAAGTPVIASDGGALPEITGDAALRVPAGSSAALARAIDALLEDPGLRERLVAAGRLRARAFPPAPSARRLAGLLEAVGRGT